MKLETWGKNENFDHIVAKIQKEGIAASFFSQDIFGVLKITFFITNTHFFINNAFFQFSLSVA